MLPASLLIGWLALGGMVMNTVRGQRKLKSHESTTAKTQALDPTATYTLADGGELVEVVDPKRKRE